MLRLEPLGHLSYRILGFFPRNRANIESFILLQYRYDRAMKFSIENFSSKQRKAFLRSKARGIKKLLEFSESVRKILLFLNLDKYSSNKGRVYCSIGMKSNRNRIQIFLIYPCPKGTVWAEGPHFFWMRLFLCDFVLYNSFVWGIVFPRRVMRRILEWTVNYA